MTDWGLKVYNESGDLQIDGEYRNHHFKSKGTLTVDGLTGSNVGATRKEIAFTNCVAPVLAIRSVNSGFICNYLVASIVGTTWTFRLIGNYNTGSGSRDVEYWLFDNINSPSSETWGLRVWDAAGALVYDSGFPPLISVDFLENLTYSPGTGVNEIYISGRKYAAIMSGGGGDSAEIPTGPIGGGPGDVATLYTSSGCSGITNGVHFDNYQYDFFLGPVTSQPGYPNHIFSHAPDWTVVDVTNL
jgi:hypothetical protein